MSSRGWAARASRSAFGMSVLLWYAAVSSSGSTTASPSRVPSAWPMLGAAWPR